MLFGHFYAQNQESWSVMTYEFRSGFARQIKEMLEHRAAMGHSVKDYNSILANFDRFCMNHFPTETILTKKIAFAWCNDAKGNGKGGFNRASALRGLAWYIFLKNKSRIPFFLDGSGWRRTAVIASLDILGRTYYFLRRFAAVRLQKNGWYEPCKSRGCAPCHSRLGIVRASDQSPWKRSENNLLT